MVEEQKASGLPKSDSVKTARNFFDNDDTSGGDGSATTTPTLSHKVSKQSSPMSHHFNTAVESSGQVAETTETRAKYTFGKGTISALLQPLTFSKTLYQLGFEPKKWPANLPLVPRHRASRLPDTFKFLKSVHEQFGLRAMYRGAAAGFVGSLTGGFVTNYVEQYLDTYFADLGGKLGDLESKEDEELTDFESFRVHLRHTIRSSIGSTVGVVISHPFAVLMVREIMKVVRHDHACPNTLSALLRVGEEEGLPGLFAGLVPSMLAKLVCVWTMFGVAFTINRMLIYIEKNTKDQENREVLKNVRSYVPFMVPFVANSFAYAFEVDAVVASVAGYSR
ncbi:hypothetical protein M3Y97_00225100 [Aphelenchoides bicaudatus]|nr:hypothetical protein M3Y97_00225100 [Aphelenchoides bicaudatus]